MITTLKINNLACFKQIELQNLKKINLILGRNETGKTWLLKALDLLTNLPKDTNSNREAVWDFDFVFHNITNAISFNRWFTETEYLCYNHLIENKISLEISTGREANKIKDLIDLLNKRYKVAKNINTINNYFISKALYLDANITSRKYLDFISQKCALNLITLDKAREFINHFIPNTNALTGAVNNGINIFIGNSNEATPYCSFGYGLQRSLLAYILCLASENSSIMLDCIETGLDFDKYKFVIQKLLEACQENNNQLFITCHSNEFARKFISQIKKSNMEKDFSAVYLYKNQDEVLAGTLSMEDVEMRINSEDNDPVKIV